MSKEYTHHLDRYNDSPYARLSYGTVAPDVSGAKAGDLWYNESTNKLNYFDLNQGVWVGLADNNTAILTTGSTSVEGVKEFIDGVKMADGKEGFATATFTQLGAATPGTALFRFTSAAEVDGTLNLIAEDTTSVTYIGKADGTVTNGEVVSGSTAFNVGTNARSAANNLKEAIDSVNGHNTYAAAATTSFDFDLTDFNSYNDTTITLTSHDGDNTLTKTYRMKNDGTADPDPDNHYATAYFTFTNAATEHSTITLTDGYGLARTYIAWGGASNGDVSSGVAEFITSNTGTDGGTLTLTSYTGKEITYEVSSGAGDSDGDLLAADATFTFGANDAVEGSSITLDSGGGVIKTYVAWTGTNITVDPDDSDRIFFNNSDQGSGGALVAANLRNAIEHANGHNGTIDATSSSAQIDLVQSDVYGPESNTPITTAGNFTDATTVDPPAAFSGGNVVVTTGASTARDFALNLQSVIEGTSGHNGEIGVTIGIMGSTLTLTQNQAGVQGNRGITTGALFTNSVSGTMPIEFSNGGYTVFVNTGAASTAAADNLQAAIEHANGHQGSIEVVNDSLGKLTLIQKKGGEDGNTAITTAAGFSTNILFGIPSSFSGGGVYEFNAGDSGSLAADNFDRIIRWGHRDKILGTPNAASGNMVLTQSKAGVSGNTHVSVGATEYLNQATATFQFGDTEHNDVNDAIIGIVAAEDYPTITTYQIKNDGTADPSNNGFNAGVTALSTANNFKELVESLDGQGVAATASFAFGSASHDSVNNAYITLINGAGGSRRFVIKNDGSAIPGTTEFNTGVDSSATTTNFKTVVESDAGFGATGVVSIDVTTTQSSTVTLTQTVPGVVGNTPITLGTLDYSWESICATAPPDSFSGGKIKIEVDTSSNDGTVVLTQEVGGVAGNTNISVSNQWGDLLDGSMPTEFTGGAGEAAAIIQFTPIFFTGVDDATLTLIDADGASVTYTSDTSGTPGTGEFDVSVSSHHAATNLAALINSSDGHDGSILAEASGSDVNLFQTKPGRVGETVITVSSSPDWNSMCNPDTPTMFTLITFNDACRTNPSNFTGGADEVLRLSTDVNREDGLVELTQVVTGDANPAITDAASFANSVSSDVPVPATFTGGTDALEDLDTKTIILTDEVPNSHTLTYSNTTATSTASTIGIQNLTSSEDIATQVHTSLNLAQAGSSINITSTDNGDGTLLWTMDNADSSNNGTMITGTAFGSMGVDPTLISVMDFAGGLAAPSPYATFDTANERLEVNTLRFSDGTSMTTASSGGGSTDEEIIGIRVDNGASAISTGVKGYRIVPYACTVTEWTVLSNDAGAIQWDINWVTYANFPNGLTSVAGSDLPNIPATNKKNQDTTVGWTKTTFAAGDIIEFEIDSVTTLTNCTLFLKIERT